MTFIRRPGNKTNHLKHILPLIPKFKGTYYEPFVGSGAVFLALKPQKWVINDINSYIAGIYEAVRDNPTGLLTRINKYGKEFMNLTNDKKLTYLRKKLVDIDPVDYLISSYCSFDGAIEAANGFRISGLYYSIFNNNTCHIFTHKYKDKILYASGILKTGKIYSKDYSIVLKNCKEGDFVFLDPPYIEEKKYNFRYTSDDFNIHRLMEVLRELDSRKVKWMMTQIHAPQVKKLFGKYKMVIYTNKNSFVTVTRKSEVIIMNY